MLMAKELIKLIKDGIKGKTIKLTLTQNSKILQSYYNQKLDQLVLWIFILEIL